MIVCLPLVRGADVSLILLSLINCVSLHPDEGCSRFLKARDQ